MPVVCSSCEKKNAVLKRPKTGFSLCKDCFFWAFEEEVHQTISSARLFTAGETVGIGASGGKDSTVLAHVMKVLNERYGYGLDLMLLSVDEGITGYRDDSLETVKRNQQQYDLPLKIVSYQELYGWTMDAIVKQVGLKNNCTFCGVFRRQALDRAAMMLKVDKICTGHNADDVAETVLMNFLRGDIARLHCHHHGERGGHPPLQAAQVRLREGDRPVRLLQEARLLLHRVRLLAQRLPGPRPRVPEGPGVHPAELHRGHHPLGGEPVREGGREDAGPGHLHALRLHLQPEAVQGLRAAGGAEPGAAQAGHREAPQAPPQAPGPGAPDREGGEETQGGRFLSGAVFVHLELGG
ncbi:UNVERIFIED_CONTAM: hypothetical protein FKN15_060583 [Acipenser sinensis]